MPTFSPHQLTAVAEDVFVAAGLEQDEARTVAEHLVQANLAGHDSHGVLRIPGICGVDGSGRRRAQVSMSTIMHETPKSWR